MGSRWSLFLDVWGLAGSWYNKLHDHLPVGGLCYIASIIWKVIAGMEEERLVPGL